MLTLTRIVTTQTCYLCSHNKGKETAEVQFGQAEQKRTVFLCGAHLWQFAKIQVGTQNGETEDLPLFNPHAPAAKGGS